MCVCVCVCDPLLLRQGLSAQNSTPPVLRYAAESLVSEQSVCHREATSLELRVCVRVRESEICSILTYIPQFAFLLSSMLMMSV